MTAGYDLDDIARAKPDLVNYLSDKSDLVNYLSDLDRDLSDPCDLSVPGVKGL